MKNNMRKINNYIRVGIQLLFFVWFPSAFTIAFSGVKYIFTQLGLQKIIELTPFFKVMLGLCLYTIVFGRFFCGYACAFGSFGDWVHGIYVWICKKRKKKPVTIKESWRNHLVYVKYIVLAAILILCFIGKYDTLKGTSVWDVFSILRAGRLQFGGYAAGVCLLIAVVVGMAVCERFFCRFLCPMGAVFSLLPVFPLFAVRRNPQECIKGCSACKRVCPSDLDLPDKPDADGDCFQCGKCIHTCPKKNIKVGVSVPGVALTIFRVLALGFVMYVIGV